MRGFPCRQSFLILHANLVRISKADTSNEVSEEEFAKFILMIKDDSSYRISFRGSIVDNVGPTEHSNVLCVVFMDHTGPQSRRLPAKALNVKNIALNSNSPGANATSPPLRLMTVLSMFLKGALVLGSLQLRCLPPSCLSVLPPFCCGRPET